MLPYGVHKTIRGAKIDGLEASHSILQISHIFGRKRVTRADHRKRSKISF